MMLYIVDDDGERGTDMLKTFLAKEGNEALWLRPELLVPVPRSNHIFFKTRESFITYVQQKTEFSAGWLWDIDLRFSDSSSFVIRDYDEGGDALKLLEEIINRGGVLAIISSDHNAQNVVDSLVRLGCRSNAIKAFGGNYGAFRTPLAKNEFCDQVVSDLLALFSGGIREIWSTSGWDQHFESGGAGLPHDYDPHTWEMFLPVIKEILGGRHITVPDILLEVIKNNFKEYYEATKTLIGAYSKCHTDDGSYAPCLSVLSILTLRAACLSRVWDEEQLIHLAKLIAPNQDMREIGLSSSKFQGKANTQEWVKIIADEVLPALIKKPNIASPANLENATSCDHAGRYFRLVFSGNWIKLTRAIHDLSGLDGGGLTDALIRLNQALGDCGPTIGRKQLCTVNAWVDENKTYIQFSATS